MNRAQFQQLAEERAEDAEALILAGRWSGAYYLAGYAVECGLKACIARLTREHDFPDKNFAEKCSTHVIEGLVGIAGIKAERDADSRLNSSLRDHRLIVKDWDEKARYLSWSESQARKLVTAVSDPGNGVLPWIKARW